MCFRFRHNKQREHSGREHEHADDLNGAPSICRTGQREGQQQRDKCQNDKYRAFYVDFTASAFRFKVRHKQHDQHNRNGADGDVDIKDPPPGEIIGYQAADQRADDARQSKNGCDDPHVFSALIWREQIGHNGKHARYDNAAADALYAAKQDQPGHVRRSAAENRTDGEDKNTGQKNRLAADDVGQAAGNRNENGGAEHIDRKRPDVKRNAV